MRPFLHPELVNEPFGDPVVFVDFLFDRRAILFDLGEISALSSRKLQRVTHVLVSHTHMDHFSGFDRLVRVLLGRNKAVAVTGPEGFIDRIGHKLAAYSWNLAGHGGGDFCIVAREFSPDGEIRAARFCFAQAFVREDLAPRRVRDGLLIEEANYRVRGVTLDHRIPCLAFALEEKQHINIWRNEVAAMGLGIGPWLRDLKDAVLRGDDGDTPIVARWRDGGQVREKTHPLKELRERLVQITPGQKVAYVTDAAPTEENERRIVDLVRKSDMLFIETPFLDEDADIAARKAHLTARQAGRIARRAGVRRIVPFHFSPRYLGREDRLAGEAYDAFSQG